MRYLFALLALPLAAAPIAGGPCVDGTLYDYLALGSQGCTAEGFTFRDWGQSAFNYDPESIPMRVSTTRFPGMDQQNTGVVAFIIELPNLVLREGEIWDWRLSYTLEGPITADLISGFYQNATNFHQITDDPGELRMVSNGLASDPIGPITYIPDHPAFHAPAQAATEFGIVATGGTDWLMVYEVANHLSMSPSVTPMVASPEPSTWILMGIGLLAIIAARRFRPAQHFR